MGAPRAKRARFLPAGALIATALTVQACQPPDGAERKVPDHTIEVLHWLGSRDEATALGYARTAFIAGGGQWRDTPMPGVAVAQSTTINRILGGAPPQIIQTSVGQRAFLLARRDLVGIAPVDAKRLDATLPPLIAEAAKLDGRYIAVPAYIRGENWMFFNRRLLADHGVLPPQTWPEFLAAARRLKRAGVVPIALGGQPWQERILFNAILAGVGGRQLYRRIYVQREPEALASPAVLQAFQTLAELRGAVDVGSPGRPWNQATQMVVDGDAAFQFMGDWAKSTIRGAGFEPGGREIGCQLAPTIDPSYIVAVDAFAFPRSTSPGDREGQALFARVILDPVVQRQMSRQLGSIPVSRIVDAQDFDPCAQIAIALTLDASTLLPSTGLFALPAGLSGALDDAISTFWHDQNLSAEDGRRLFVNTMLAYPPAQSQGQLR